MVRPGRWQEGCKQFTTTNLNGTLICSFADIQSMSRGFCSVSCVSTDILFFYPILIMQLHSHRVSQYSEFSSDERRITELQLEFADRMRKSQYYIVMGEKLVCRPT
jgi:hypothetical protein